MLKLSHAVIIFALTTTLALAQTPQPSPSDRIPATTPGVIGPRGAGGGHGAADRRAQQAAPISLVQAIASAEARGRGRAIYAGFEVDSKGGHYEVKVLEDDGTFIEHHVDPTSGQVMKSDTHPVEGFLIRIKPNDIQNLRTTLQQAIILAEHRAGGRAAEAEVERDGGKVFYRITIVNGEWAREIKVDGNSVEAPSQR